MQDSLATVVLMSVCLLPSSFIISSSFVLLPPCPPIASFAEVRCETGNGATCTVRTSSTFPSILRTARLTRGRSFFAPFVLLSLSCLCRWSGCPLRESRRQVEIGKPVALRSRGRRVQGHDEQRRRVPPAPSCRRQTGEHAHVCRRRRRRWRRRASRSARSRRGEARAKEGSWGGGR